MSIDFNGTNQRLALGNVDIGTALDPVNTLTICTWANPRSPTAVDHRWISKASGTDEGQHYWMLGQSTAGANLRTRIRISGVGTTTLVAAGAITSGAWNHYAVVYNNSTLKLFKNGVEVASTALTGFIDQSNVVPARIGSNGDGTGHHKGFLENMRIYYRALSASELLTLYRMQGKAPMLEGMQHWWPMQQQTSGIVSADVRDIIGGWNGTPENSPTYAAMFSLVTPVSYALTQ